MLNNIFGFSFFQKVEIINRPLYFLKLNCMPNNVKIVLNQIYTSVLHKSVDDK